MQKIGLWQITAGRPQRIQEGHVDLERRLEDWIEADPDLLQVGLTIIGRQIELEGGRLDLLALDPQGRWVIIEIKRGILRRETIAQALDYASCLAKLTTVELQAKVYEYLQSRGLSLQSLLNEREIQESTTINAQGLQLFIVGTGKAPGLERMVSFLADSYSVPITLVSFDVYQLDNEQHILAREITEPDISPPYLPENPSVDVEQACLLADQNGVGPMFRAILAAAKEHDLYPRAYKASIMYTFPAQRNRMLFTTWVKPSPRGLKVYISPKVFAEFYPVTEEKATEILGENGWRELNINTTQVQEFINSIHTLFQQVNQSNT